jgi:hypothetical protein
MKKNILAALVLISILAIAKPILRVPDHVTIDYNEGWNAFFADRAVSGGALYQSLDAYVVNNYPPLSFYIVGSLGKLLGDTIIAGRILSLFGLLLSSIMIMTLIRFYTNSNFHAVLGGLLVIAYMGIYHCDYIGMNDPHWLAQGLMTAGLVVFVYREKFKFGIYFSLAIMLFAGFIKHSFLAIPLSCTVWIWLYERKLFSRWILTSIGLLILSFSALGFIYGKLFFEDIFFSPRTYRVGALGKVGAWLQPAIVYFICSAAFFISDKSKGSRFLLIVTSLSLLFGSIAIGGGGVYKNLLYECVSLFIAISVIGLYRWDQSNRQKILLGSIGLMLPILFMLPTNLYFDKEWKKGLANIESVTEADIRFIKKAQEPVMCENLALCYWSGKSFSFDFFSTGQKLKTGRIEYVTVKKMIVNHQFSLIQLDDSSGRSNHLPNEITESILNSYRVARKSINGIFLVPKAESVEHIQRDSF